MPLKLNELLDFVTNYPDEKKVECADPDLKAKIDPNDLKKLRFKLGKFLINGGIEFLEYEDRVPIDDAKLEVILDECLIEFDYDPNEVFNALNEYADEAYKCKPKLVCCDDCEFFIPNTWGIGTCILEHLSAPKPDGSRTSLFSHVTHNCPDFHKGNLSNNDACLV